MDSVVLVYLAAVICSATQTHTLPLYSEPNQEIQADFIQKLVSEGTDGVDAGEGDRREVNHLFPLLMQQNGGSDPWNKVGKEGAPQEKYTKMVEDLKDVVLRLEAADKMRMQGFQRSEQNLPKTNKRACFWKYCVTN